MREPQRARLEELLADLDEFRFCGPSDDVEQQYAVVTSYRSLVTQFKLLARRFVGRDVMAELEDLDVDTLEDAFDAAAVVSVAVLDVREALHGGETRGDEIPREVITVVGDVLGAHYYSHSRLNRLFVEAGAPGDAPEGTCVFKCQSWLRRCNEAPGVRSTEVLGHVLQEFMDFDVIDDDPEWEGRRSRVHQVLSRNRLEYRRGGMVAPTGSRVASGRLGDFLKARDFSSIEEEFERALAATTTDPPAALTAACAIVEAACKTYIEVHELELPSKQTIQRLWSVVQADLGLQPERVEDDDLKRILGGLGSIVAGLGALRTHASSAHGRSQTRYRLAPRHSKLAVNSAHTLVLFLLETWTERDTASRSG